MLRFVRQLRAGRFDLAVSLVRSPLMSVAVLVSRIRGAPASTAPVAVRLNVSAPIVPSVPRHEGEIYLDVARALGLDVTDCCANVPVDEPTPKRSASNCASAGSPALIWCSIRRAGTTPA